MDKSSFDIMALNIRNCLRRAKQSVYSPEETGDKFKADEAAVERMFRAMNAKKDPQETISMKDLYINKLERSLEWASQAIDEYKAEINALRKEKK